MTQGMSAGWGEFILGETPLGLAAQYGPASLAYADILRLLFPLRLGSANDADVGVEGRALDSSNAAAFGMLAEMFPDTAALCLSDWERTYGLTPLPAATAQERRAAVLALRRGRGGLSRAAFIALAAAMGYAITIGEPAPFSAGVNRCGDQLLNSDTWWTWTVTVAAGAGPAYRFRAGQSAVGEGLLSFPATESLVNLFNKLKPADTAIVFYFE